MGYRFAYPKASACTMEHNKPSQFLGCAMGGRHKLNFQTPRIGDQTNKKSARLARGAFLIMPKRQAFCLS